MLVSITGALKTGKDAMYSIPRIIFYKFCFNYFLKISSHHCIYSLSSEGVREAVVVCSEVSVEALKNKLNSDC